MDNIFYVYVYFRLDGTPCYVGKGKGLRFRCHRKPSKKTHLSNIIKNSNSDLPVIFVRENLTEFEAFETEAALIAAIGREPFGPLVNLTDGWEGNSGFKWSIEQRNRRTEYLKERWKNPAIKEAAKIRMIGNRRRRGKTMPKEFGEALSARMQGNTNTLGLKHTDEARQKMSAAKKGKLKSEEWRKKISEANRIAWIARRERMAST